MYYKEVFWILIKNWFWWIYFEIYCTISFYILLNNRPLKLEVWYINTKKIQAIAQRSSNVLAVYS